MTITMTKESRIKAEGTRTNKNRKPIFNITTGEVYASAIDAAEKLGVNPSAISWVITGRMHTVKGVRLCPLANVTEHLEEIATNMRAKNQKARLYDEAIAHQEAVKKANERYAYHQERYEKLKHKLEQETELLATAEREVTLLKEASVSMYMM